MSKQPNAITDTCNNATDNKACESKDSRVKHGVIYTPSEDGKRYSFEKYNTDNHHVEYPQAYQDKTSSEQTPNNESKLNRKAAVIILACILCCVILILAASLITALVTERYLSSKYQNVPGDQLWQDSIQADNNHIYIDNEHKPGYVTKPVTPGEIMTMEQAIATVKDSVVEILAFNTKDDHISDATNAGSGVIISTGGYIITNNHVINGAGYIKVKLTDGSEYDASVIGVDLITDIAVLLISPSSDTVLSAATIGSDTTLALGQTVIAIGNPLTQFGGTVTDGIISSLTRQVAVSGVGKMSLLQTNAAVSLGSSGGGLFDLYGRLVGIVNAKPIGEGIEGVSFAIPIDTAWDVTQQLIDKGYVSGRPSIGVILEEIKYKVGYFNGPEYNAVVVADSNKIDDFREDDIIISIEGMEISTQAQISEVLSYYSIGDEVIVRVRRQRGDYDIKVKLIEYAPIDQDDPKNK